MGFVPVALCASLLAGRAEPPRIGAPVPDFTATALDGTVVSLHDAAATHRVVVVLFLSTVCPYANSFGKRVGQLAQELGPQRVLFIGINSNQSETAQEMEDSATAHGQTFPLVRDSDASIADRLGASCSPEAYVVDREGRLRYHGWVRSKLRSPDLERALEAILSGRPVWPARTKAFGCAIDRTRASDRLTLSGLDRHPLPRHVCSERAP